MEREELLWRQYTTHIDLYKTYLDIVLKANVAFYAIAGALVSYFLAHRDDGLSRLALALPTVFSLGLTFLAFYGARLLRPVRDELYAIASALNLETAPEMRVLAALLVVSAVGFACSSVALIYLLGPRVTGRLTPRCSGPGPCAVTSGKGGVWASTVFAAPTTSAGRAAELKVR